MKDIYFCRITARGQEKCHFVVVDRVEFVKSTWLKVTMIIEISSQEPKTKLPCIILESDRRRGMGRSCQRIRNFGRKLPKSGPTVRHSTFREQIRTSVSRGKNQR